MSKVLVTGGAGFIGSNLVDALISEGNDVFIIDNLSTGLKENINPKARFYQLDIKDEKISEVFKNEKPEFIFHLAAQIDVRKSVADPVNDADINILGSLNVMENAKMASCKKIIFASTGGAIYGDTAKIPTSEKELARPVSPYAIAKYSIENYLYYYNFVFGVEYTALRFANVYGPRQNSEGEAGVVAIFCGRLLNKKQPIIYGDGKQTRDYIYVGDVVKACVSAMKSPGAGIFNVGTSKETDVNELFEMIKKALKADMNPIAGGERRGEQKRSCLDFGKISKEMSWRPQTKLEDGIKITAEWFRARCQ